MNNDLISRSALKKYARTRISEEIVTNQIILKLFDELIDDAPAVEPFEPDYVGAERLDARQRGYEDAKAEYQRPQGEWIIDSDNLPVCRECGEVALQRVFVKMPHLIQEVRMVKSNFCPNCGAKMVSSENN